MQAGKTPGFFIPYAFRSLWRNRRRSLLTIVTVAFSSTFSLVGQRYTAAIMKIWVEGVSDTGTGDLQVHRTAYATQSDPLADKNLLEEANQTELELQADHDVVARVRRLNFEGIVSHGTKSVYFSGHGVEPENEMQVSPRLFTQNDEGQFVSSLDPSGVVIGRGLAHSLELKLGDPVALVASAKTGSVEAWDGVVRGIVDVPIPSFSQRTLYMPLAGAQELLRMPRIYNELAVRLRPGTGVHAWVNEHRETWTRFDVALHGWWDLEPLIPKIQTLWDSVMGIIAILLFLSAALSVLNIVFMLISERVEEIGTLMAIGARERDVQRLFQTEAAMMGILGGLLGCVAGNALVLAMGWRGVPFKSPFGSTVVIVRPEMHFGMSSLILLLAVLICLAASWAPSRRASRVEPVRAIRGQI